MPTADILALLLAIVGAFLAKLGGHGVVDAPTTLAQRVAVALIATGAVCMVVAIWLVS